jgi:hypothetical protein
MKLLRIYTCLVLHSWYYTPVPPEKCAIALPTAAALAGELGSVPVRKKPALLSIAVFSCTNTAATRDRKHCQAAATYTHTTTTYS